MLKRYFRRVLSWVDWHLDAIAFWALVAAVACSIGEYVLLVVLLSFGDATQPWCANLATLYFTFSVLLPATVLLGFSLICYITTRK